MDLSKKVRYIIANVKIRYPIVLITEALLSKDIDRTDMSSNLLYSQFRAVDFESKKTLYKIPRFTTLSKKPRGYNYNLSDNPCFITKSNYKTNIRKILTSLPNKQNSSDKGTSSHHFILSILKFTNEDATIITKHCFQTGQLLWKVQLHCSISTNLPCLAFSLLLNQVLFIPTEGIVHSFLLDWWTGEVILTEHERDRLQMRVEAVLSAGKVSSLRNIRMIAFLKLAPKTQERGVSIPFKEKLQFDVVKYDHGAKAHLSVMESRKMGKISSGVIFDEFFLTKVGRLKFELRNANHEYLDYNESAIEIEVEVEKDKVTTTIDRMKVGGNSIIVSLNEYRSCYEIFTFL